MCNLSWTPHSNLEKDNSLKTTPVLAQRWAVWSILTKNAHLHRTKKQHPQSVSTAPTVMRLLNISCSTAHCTTTSEQDYCHLPAQPKIQNHLRYAAISSSTLPCVSKLHRNALAMPFRKSCFQKPGCVSPNICRGSTICRSSKRSR